MMRKILEYLSRNKFKVHFAALVMMVASPIMMYFGVPIETKAFVFAGIGLMVIANLLALGTK
jgi:hypothetical protein